MPVNHFTLGIRFQPTEEELVNHYLKFKILGIPFADPTNRFQEFELYNHTPEQLRERYGVQKEREMYIFVKKEPKHPTGKRLKRTTTSNGRWRASTKEIEIRSLDNNNLVGYRRTLVYHSGEGRGTKTNWLMYEYRFSDDKISFSDEWLLCKVYLNGKEETNIMSQVNLELEPRATLNSSPKFNKETLESANNKGTPHQIFDGHDQVRRQVQANLASEPNHDQPTARLR